MTAPQNGQTRYSGGISLAQFGHDLRFVSVAGGGTGAGAGRAAGAGVAAAPPLGGVLRGAPAHHPPPVDADGTHERERNHALRDGCAGHCWPGM